MIAEKHDLWAHIAMVYGFNELARNAETLGEKVAFRLMVSKIEEWLVAHGVTIPKSSDNSVVLEIPCGPMTMQFRESDLELMRAAVAKLDAERLERKS